MRDVDRRRSRSEVSFSGATTRSRDPAAAEKICDLHAEHEEEASRLRRAAQVVERVLNDQDLLRETVGEIIHDFIAH
jgi:hypothetical protein